MFANLGVWFSKTTLPARSAITKTAGTWSTTRKTTSRASRLQSERQVCSTPFPSWLFSHGDASFPIALRCGTDAINFNHGGSPPNLQECHIRDIPAHSGFRRGSGTRESAQARTPPPASHWQCGEKSNTTDHKPFFGNKTPDKLLVKLQSGRQFQILPHTSEKKGG